MKVLLSIKPEFVEKIFAGTKKYEFRKSLFKRSDVKFVVIYASAPIKRVVGEFEIDDILSDDVNTIWERTGTTHTAKRNFRKPMRTSTHSASGLRSWRIF